MRASQLIITNMSMIFNANATFSEEVSFQDGALNIFAVKSRKLWDFAFLFFARLFRLLAHHENVVQIHGVKHIVIETRHPALAQSDGEIIGKTPLKVEVLPKSLTVIGNLN